MNDDCYDSNALPVFYCRSCEPDECDDCKRMGVIASIAADNCGIELESVFHDTKGHWITVNVAKADYERYLYHLEKLCWFVFGCSHDQGNKYGIVFHVEPL
jgi:hypothetical protein